jgi:hypothetical protein
MKTKQLTVDELEGIEAVYQKYFIDDVEMEVY